MQELSADHAVHGTLVANEVAVVRLDQASGNYSVKIVNVTGDAPIYCRSDGVDPEVRGDDSFVVLDEETWSVRGDASSSETVEVRLISEGEPEFAVEVGV